MVSAETCAQQWYLGYEKNLALIKERRARRLGTMFHLAAAFYRASKMAEPYPWFFEQDLRSALVAECEGMEADIETTMEILGVYMSFCEGDDFDILAIEEEVSVRVGQLAGSTPAWIRLEAETLARLLPNVQSSDASFESIEKLRHRLTHFDEEIVTARPDLRIRKQSTSRAYIVDYKTKGISDWKRPRLPTWNPKGEYWIDPQVLHNLHVVRAAGQQVDGFIIERIKREKPYDVSRNVVDVPPLVYRDSTLFMRQNVLHELRWLTFLQAGIALPKNFSACYGRRWPCDFREHCASGGAAEGELYEARR